MTHRLGALDGLFVALSRLGYAGVLWILIAAGAALLWRRPAIVLLVMTGVWSADLIATGIKEAVDRPRPFVGDPEPAPLVHPAGASFPSGHAATAFAGAALVSCYLPGRWPVLFALAVAIAFSRLYLGVHFPSDVLAGAALGLLVATALLRLAGALRRPRQGPTGD